MCGVEHSHWSRSVKILCSDWWNYLAITTHPKESKKVNIRILNLNLGPRVHHSAEVERPENIVLQVQLPAVRGDDPAVRAAMGGDTDDHHV